VSNAVGILHTLILQDEGLDTKWIDSCASSVFLPFLRRFIHLWKIVDLENACSCTEKTWTLLAKTSLKFNAWSKTGFL